MHYVYWLKSKLFDKSYIGKTNNVVKRLAEHNAGLSQSTKPYRPWRCAYLEGYATRDEADDRERKLKQFGKVYSQLKRRIWRSLRS